MGRFTAIPQDTFESLQLDAGVLLKNFDPANPGFEDEDLVTATTGGITVTATPTFSDQFEDVDNAPNGVKEGMKLDSWDTSIATTGINTSPEMIKLALGCADIDPNNASKVTLRRDVLQTDFTTIWWVGDRADGGCVAVKLKNALSTGGLSLQTSKNGKGQTSITLTGHVSINAQDEMPMEFYSIDPVTDTWSVTQTLTNVVSSFSGSAITKGGNFSATLAAPSGYTIEADDVAVTVGGEDVTSTAWDSSTSTITISGVTGNVVITATATSVNA